MWVLLPDRRYPGWTFLSFLSLPDRSHRIVKERPQYEVVCGLVFCIDGLTVVFHLFEGLFEVGDEIFDVFTSDRETDEVVVGGLREHQGHDIT